MIIWLDIEKIFFQFDTKKYIVTLIVYIALSKTP